MSEKTLHDKKLALFFTFGTSMKRWNDVGIIDREVAIYNRMSKSFKEIYFFTYGDKNDLKFQEHLEGNIKLIPTPFRWKPKKRKDRPSLF